MKLNKNINYKQKVLLGLTSNFVIAFLISYFFVFSYINRVEEASILLINHRVEFETKLIKEEKFSKISKNLTKIELDLRKIEKAFIDTNNKLEFITMFEGLADRTGIDMKMNINFEKISSKDSSAPLTLTLNGPYDNLMNFLVSVENLNYYINVNNIDIKNSNIASSRTVAPNQNRDNSLTMQLSALTYWK
ncbi:MAG: type 4a pilus biogenesis protein PilO [Patescibacteria group bacterium]|jgi:Tfp pilus assembly protein PilO|nr:type 4a pilus biogenesis protein PilO [Patescibacteria group bacterium]